MVYLVVLKKPIIDFPISNQSRSDNDREMYRTKLSRHPNNGIYEVIVKNKMKGS